MTQIRLQNLTAPSGAASELGRPIPLWRARRQSARNAVEELASGALHVARALLLRASRVRADIAVLVPLLMGVGFVQATNMLHWPDINFDEGTYIGNAWAVQHYGALGFYTFSYGHPPLAWIAMSLWTWVTGLFGHIVYSIDSERTFMLVVSLVSCWLVYLLARRLRMRRAFAAGAVVLFALSPLALYFHRLVLLDNPAIAWVLAAFVLALSPRRRLWAFAASGACFAAAVLSKETVFVLLPALVVAAVQNSDRRTRRYCLTLFISFLSITLITYPLYALLKGELLPGQGHVSLVGSIVYQLYSRDTTGSVLNPHSAGHATAAFWLQLDPWLLVAALALSPLALARRGTRAVTVAYLLQVLMIFRAGYLPNMYVIGLLPFAALMVAGTADGIWRNLVRGWYILRRDRRMRRLLRAKGKWRAAGARASIALTPVWALALAATIWLASPAWIQSDRRAMSVQLDSSARAAESWLATHVSHNQRTLVGEDSFWIYLIEHGFASQPIAGGFYSPTVVSYWTLDYDPAVKHYFPQGWREFDYVVSTLTMRVTAYETPNTAQALQHSRLVVSFGRGADRIEIRTINKGMGT